MSASSHGAVMKGTRLLKPPRTLCLHLKRLTFNSAGKPEKIRTPVTYSVDLSLNNLIAKEYEVRSLIESAYSFYYLVYLVCVME